MRSAGECSGFFPKSFESRRLPDVFSNSEQTRKYALDVSVENRLRSIEGDRRYGTCRVSTDSRQRLQGLGVVRKFPAVVLIDHTRGGLQIARTRVIAEARPRSEYIVEICGRECVHIGEAAEKTLPVGDDGFDAGLLEHRF